MRKLLITLFFVILIIALLFLSQPQLRHIVITGVIQFPEFATMQAMKGGLITRDFNRVIPWLERQMDLTTFYGKTKNKMTPGMLENISKAYEAAVLKEERERFIPILERAYILNPNNIDLHVMLASAYQFSDKKKSIDYLNKAKLILPSDQRIYSLANILLKDSNDAEQKMKWCLDYKSALFGDYSQHKGSSLLGVGYRRVALEFSDGNTRKLYLNEGVILGKRQKYEFIFDGIYEIKNPSVRVSNGGGIQVEIHQLDFYKQGGEARSLESRLIQLFPETGYLLDNKVISTNLYGENIFLEMIDLDEIKADKIVLDLTINKLPLNSLAFCNSKDAL